MKESGENYLETILILSRNGTVHSVDVANALGYSKPSVSRAVGILRENGLIRVDRGGAIELTEAGALAASAVYERHRTIARFLTETLGVSPAAAEQDACRIEHIISAETFRRIKEFVERDG